MLACATLTVLLSGCGGVNAGGGASPSSFFIPGLVGHEGAGRVPSHINVSDTPGKEAVDSSGSVVIPSGPLHVLTEIDPS